MNDSSHAFDTRSSPRMRRSYVRVLVIWIVVLVSLYFFQSYFS